MKRYQTIRFRIKPDSDTRLISRALARLDDLKSVKQTRARLPQVRLHCTGELLAIGSVALVGLRESPQVVELIEFICPRCEQLHASRRFR